MHYAWMMQLRESGAAGYRALHDGVWPDVLKALGEAGCRNYSIFIHGDTIFGYFECDDIFRVAAVQKTSPALARWRDAVSKFAHNQPDETSGGPPLMQPVFRFDGGGIKP